MIQRLNALFSRTGTHLMALSCLVMVLDQWRQPPPADAAVAVWTGTLGLMATLVWTLASRGEAQRDAGLVLAGMAWILALLCVVVYKPGLGAALSLAASFVFKACRAPQSAHNPR